MCLHSSPAKALKRVETLSDQQALRKACFRAPAHTVVTRHTGFQPALCAASPY